MGKNKQTKSELLVKEIEKLLMRGPVSDIYQYESSRNIFELISVNSHAINEAGFGEFFGHAQNLLVSDMLLRVCKMFESSKKFEMRTYPAIITLIKKNASILPVSKPTISNVRCEDNVLASLIGAKFIKSRRLLPVRFSSPKLVPDIKKTIETMHELEDEMPCINDKEKNRLSSLYAEIKKLRDKEVAHNENVSREILPRPTFEMLEELVTWAKNAVGKVRELVSPTIITFLKDGTYSLSTDAKRPCTGLQRILSKLEIPVS